jgi:hypothetical protein
MTDAPKIAYTVEEAVAASGISRSRLYEHHAAGVITMRKAGRRTLILGDELRSLIEALPAAPRRAA